MTGVQDAIAAADGLIHFADFSEFTPAVDESSLKSMLADWHKKTERSGVK